MAKNNTDLFSNLSWKFAERISAQSVTMVVSIVLARILSPDDYGLIAIVTIFISIANTFVSGGLGNALIQKEHPDALDYSSVLYFNILFSIFLYIILFISAPFIADFYGEGYSLLTPVLRVLGLRIIVAGINSVQQAYVSKKMIFKKFFLATLFGTVLSGIVGIAMAYSGFGVWALVAQYMTNTTVDTIVLGLSLRKKPLIAFSFKRVKNLAGFGFGILGASLLITFFEEFRSLLIGKVYTSSDLAHFDKGKQFPSLVVTNINTSIGAVLFPKMANEQSNVERIKKTARTSIRFSSYIMSPLMIGLAAVAEPFVRVVLTDKWLPCVPYLQLFCVFYLLQPIHTANMQAIKAVGRSDTYLRIEIVKKVVELIVLIITIRQGVIYVAIGMTVLATLFIFVNSFPNRKLINYSIKEQLMDIVPALLLSAIMFVCVYLVGKILTLPLLITFIIQILSGAIIYVALSIVTKNHEFGFIVNAIKEKL